MQRGKVRIIAGKWRSRLLSVPRGVRPAQDKQRETIFSILKPYIDDSSCLDLFAGTGSFGFEALSRGAHNTVFVDQSSQVVNSLRESISTLNAQGKVIKSDVFAWLKKPPVQQFDLVFVDPPYMLSKKSKWWDKLLTLLLPHLKDTDTRVCVEGPAPIIPDADTWERLRHGRTGSAYWSILSTT